MASRPGPSTPPADGRGKPSDPPELYRPPHRRSSSFSSAHSSTTRSPETVAPKRTRNFNSSSQLSEEGRKVIPFTYGHLVELSRKDANEIIMDLMDKLDDFVPFLKSNLALGVNRITLIIELLSKMCSSYFRESKITILKVAATVPFLQTLEIFVGSLKDQIFMEKRPIYKLFWTKADEFFANLLVVCESFIDLIPTTPFNMLRNLLELVDFLIAHQEKQKIVRGSRQPKSKSKILIEKLIFRKKQLEQGRENSDDFRTLNAYPSSEEILTENYALPSDYFVEGRYDNVNHYLEVQFRLLKEAYVAPLRKDIAKCREDTTGIYTELEISTIRTYPHVVFGTTVVHFHKLGVTLSFPKLEDFEEIFSPRSRSFELGYLVFFTKDNFETILIGTVIDRYFEKHQLVIGFQPQHNHYESDVPYTMVKINPIFSAYHYTMKALQYISEDDFPMKSYFVDAAPRVESLSYLNPNSVCTIQGSRVKLFGDDWPTADQLKLDSNQYSAFKAALTQKFTLIQGPFGTGKTHLGLKIVKTLLHNDNRRMWYNGTPILIVCSSNEGLDNFLEGLISTTGGIIRVGYGSINENLVEFSLKCARKKIKVDRDVEDTLRNKMAKLMKHLENCSDNLNLNRSFIAIIRDLSYMDKDLISSWFSRASNDDLFKWLCHGQNTDVHSMEISDIIRDATEEKKRFDSVGENPTAFCGTILWSKSFLWLKIGITINQMQRMEACKTIDMNQKKEYEATLKDLWQSYQCFKIKMRDYKPVQPPNKPPNVNYNSPSQMDHTDRWNLYFYWLDLIQEKFLALQCQHRELSQNITEIQNLLDSIAMKDALVVGMTVITATRLYATLQTLKCRIVIVEEACEIVESHIVASLSKHCEQLILFGNSQTLMPTSGTDNEKVAKKEISIMQRMMRNNMPCHVLGFQYRMRPEIEELVAPRVDPNLETQYSLAKFSDVVGIPFCTYFINHEHGEITKFNSRMNLYEIEYLLKLACYFRKVGYECKDIVILASFSGQKYAFIEERKKYEDLIRGVRIFSLDTCQNVECKIILVSLVRNNSEGKIGFLAFEQNVNLGLSRAIEGLYIMGNVELLRQNSTMWARIIEILVKRNCVGNRLPVCCKINPEHVTYIEKPEDFDQVSDVGCSKICGSMLNCHHPCSADCHPLDRAHTCLVCT